MEVGAYEAKTRLSELLERVRNGERFVITKHGLPVAELVPATEGRRRDVPTIARELAGFREGRRLAPVTLRELIDEGRT